MRVRGKKEGFQLLPPPRNRRFRLTSQKRYLIVFSAESQGEGSRRVGNATIIKLFNN